VGVQAALNAGAPNNEGRRLRDGEIIFDEDGDTCFTDGDIDVDDSVPCGRRRRAATGTASAGRA